MHFFSVRFFPTQSNYKSSLQKTYRNHKEKHACGERAKDRDSW